MFTRPTNNKEEILRIVLEQDKEYKKRLLCFFRAGVFFLKSIVIAMLIVLPLLFIGIFVVNWLMHK